MVGNFAIVVRAIQMDLNRQARLMNTWSGLPKGHTINLINTFITSSASRMTAQCAVGIFLGKSGRARVTNVHLDDNNSATPVFDGGFADILMFHTNHSDVADDRFSGGFRGIHLKISNNSQVSRNRLEANAEDAIGLYSSRDNAVRKNVVTGNLLEHLEAQLVWYVIGTRRLQQAGSDDCRPARMSNPADVLLV